MEAMLEGQPAEALQQRLVVGEVEAGVEQRGSAAQGAVVHLPGVGVAGDQVAAPGDRLGEAKPPSCTSFLEPFNLGDGRRDGGDVQHVGAGHQVVDAQVLHDGQPLLLPQVALHGEIEVLAQRGRHRLLDGELHFAGLDLQDRGLGRRQDRLGVDADPPARPTPGCRLPAAPEEGRRPPSGSSMN